MIVLDTNVISEIMRPDPAPPVLEWLRWRDVAELCTTTINIAEIRYGLSRLDYGTRKSNLEAKFSNFVTRGFGHRILDFDAAAASAYGELVVTRERGGRPLQGFDGLIAAIVQSRGFLIATRDSSDFEGCGIGMINPWKLS